MIIENPKTIKGAVYITDSDRRIIEYFDVKVIVTLESPPVPLCIKIVIISLSLFPNLCMALITFNS